MAREQKQDVSTHIVRIFFFTLTGGFTVFIVYGITALAIPIAISFLLAFSLDPMADFLEALGIPRILAIAIVLISVVFLSYLVAIFLFPLIESEYQSIIGKSDIFLEKAEVLLASFKIQAGEILPGYVLSNLELDSITLASASQFIESMASDFDFGSIIGELVTYLLITPIIAFLFLLQGGEIFKRVIGMVPNRYFEMVLLVVNKMKTQITSYLRGLSIQWLILVVILAGGYYLVGLEYGPLLGLMAATVNIIPYMGPVIGLGPAIAVAMLDPSGALIVPVLLIFGFSQVVDNVFTQPVVLAKSVQLHPLIAILAVIAAQNLLGVVGLIIAIPTTGIMMATIQVVYKYLKAFRII